MTDQIETPGPTNDYPEGKLCDSDEGGLEYIVGLTPTNHVLVEFGKPVAWIGLRPKDAAVLANALIKYARDGAKNTGDVLSIEL